MSPLFLDVSLWSANLTNLAESIRAVDPLVDSFHLDVSDGHYSNCLVFFPDLVAQLRPLTSKPLHVHLFVRRPADWIDPFADAGVDMISVHQPARDLLARIRRRGCRAGLAISLDHPLTFIEGFDYVVLMATRIGIKGVSAEPRIYSRIRHMASHLREIGRREQVKILVDGGIRRETVPLFREAGADGVVPGSLVFGAPDRPAVFSWLRSL